jgi:hypothetical protein
MTSKQSTNYVKNKRNQLTQSSQLLELKEQLMLSSIDDLKLLSKKNKDLCKLYTKKIEVELDNLILKKIEQATTIKKLLGYNASNRSTQKLIWSTISNKTKELLDKIASRKANKTKEILDKIASRKAKAKELKTLDSNKK